MLDRNATHRRFVAWLVALTLLLATQPRPVAASIFGEENATLAAILGEQIAEVAKAVETVEGIFRQIDQLKNMLAQGERMLSQADLRGLLSLAQDATNTYGQVARDVRYLGYTAERIDSQRDKLYQDSYSNESSSNFHKIYLSYNDATLESTKVAVRAQTNLETLGARMETQREILSRSESTAGVVGQLQLLIQMTGLVHSDLDAVQRTLDSGFRMIATQAAGQASTAKLRDVAHKRELEGYTNPGPKPKVLTRLP